jgi:sugar phosphate permease
MHGEVLMAVRQTVLIPEEKCSVGRLFALMSLPRMKTAGCCCCVVSIVCATGCKLAPASWFPSQLRDALTELYVVVSDLEAKPNEELTYKQNVLESVFTKENRNEEIFFRIDVAVYVTRVTILKTVKTQKLRICWLCRSFISMCEM